VLSPKTTDGAAPRGEVNVKLPAGSQPAGARPILDVVVALLFTLGAVTYAAGTRAAMDPRFFAVPAGNDVWFEADLPTVADLVLHRWSDHSRDINHPLFPLLTIVPSYGLKALGASDAHRLLALTVLGAAMWSAVVYALLRLATPSRRDAVVFALLAHVSAASLFWLPTTETYVLGSTTLIVPVALVAWDRRARVAEGWYVAASTLSLSITTSNWMAGIMAAFCARRAPRAVQITMNALAVVVLLWGAQKVLVPSAPFFIGGGGHSRFVFPEAAAGPAAVSRALLVHSMVMPRIDVVPEPKWGTRMSVQRSPLGSSGPVGAAATLVWAILLGTGVVSLWRTRRLSPFVPALALTTVGQCAVYLCYGEEAFLYSLHIAPLLTACVAATTWTAHRRWATPLAAVLIVLLVVNNLRALSTSLEYFSTVARTILPLR
jgi:hypothetical protein